MSMRPVIVGKLERLRAERKIAAGIDPANPEKSPNFWEAARLQGESGEPERPTPSPVPKAKQPRRRRPVLLLPSVGIEVIENQWKKATGNGAELIIERDHASGEIKLIRRSNANDRGFQRECVHWRRSGRGGKIFDEIPIPRDHVRDQKRYAIEFAKALRAFTAGQRGPQITGQGVDANKKKAAERARLVIDLAVGKYASRGRNASLLIAKRIGISRRSVQGILYLTTSRKARLVLGSSAGEYATADRERASLIAKQLGADRKFVEKVLKLQEILKQTST